jgi:hypothetical protein
MSTYQTITYPVRRIDGLIVLGEAGPLPTDPTLLGMTISGEDFDINGVAYKMPTTAGASDTSLTTDGAGNLTWAPVSGLGFEQKIQDADGNTSVNVDIFGTGADDTIRFTAGGDEVLVVTEAKTTFTNSIDVSEKFTFTTSSTIPGVSFFYVTFKDNYMYVPMQTGDLVIVDVSDINNPITVSTTAVGSSFQYNSQFYGNYLFISSSAAANLIVVDINDQTSPFIAHTIICNRIGTFVIAGSYMYILCGTSPENLEIYNISDPLNEVLLSTTVITPGVEPNAGGMRLKDNVLYFFIGIGINFYIYSYDVSDPLTPTQLDILLLTSDSSRIEQLVIVGNYAFTKKDKIGAGTRPSGLISINISDPSNMTIADTNFPFVTESVGNNYSLEVLGKYAYILIRTATSTLYSFNIEDPNNIVFLNTIALPVGDLSINAYKDYFAITTSPPGVKFIKFNVGYNQFVETGNITSTIMDVDGDVNVSSNVSVEGSANITGGLGVLGDVNVNQSFQVTNSLTSNGSSVYSVTSTGSLALTLDREYGINASNAAVATYTLPLIDDSRVGSRYVITKETTNDINLVASGANVIWDGTTENNNQTLTSINVDEVYEVFCNGVKWFIS